MITKPMYCVWEHRFYAAPKELELVRRIYTKKGFTNIVVQVNPFFVYILRTSSSSFGAA